MAQLKERWFGSDKFEDPRYEHKTPSPCGFKFISWRGEELCLDQQFNTRNESHGTARSKQGHTGFISLTSCGQDFLALIPT